MTNNEFGLVLLTLAVFLGGVHGLGYLFERLHQPRLVGEILTGILLGPWVLKLLAPSIFYRLFNTYSTTQTILGFVYNLGLVLLMFCSGSETRRLMAKENQRQVFTLIGVADVANFTLVLRLGSAGRHLPVGSPGYRYCTCQSRHNRANHYRHCDRTHFRHSDLHGRCHAHCASDT